MLGTMMKRRRGTRLGRGDRTVVMATALSAVTLAVGGLMLLIG